jgi:hypothetical protein
MMAQINLRCDAFGPGGDVGVVWRGRSTADRSGMTSPLRNIHYPKMNTAIFILNLRMP